MIAAYQISDKPFAADRRGIFGLIKAISESKGVFFIKTGTGDFIILY